MKELIKELESYSWTPSRGDEGSSHLLDKIRYVGKLRIEDKDLAKKVKSDYMIRVSRFRYVPDEDYFNFVANTFPGLKSKSAVEIKHLVCEMYISDSMRKNEKYIDNLIKYGYRGDFESFVLAKESSVKEICNMNDLLKEWTGIKTY